MSICLHSQTPSPTKEKASKDITSFIPANWKLIQQAAGELNKDKISDLAIVIQDTDKKKIIVNNGTDTLDSNPRALLILFGEPEGGYKLIARNDSFILPHDNPAMDDPFSGISIDKGNLKIHFHIFMNAGSWETSENTYLFRWQNNGFALIGYDSHEFHRASGESTGYSVNFLSKKYSVTKGNEFDQKVKPKTVWHTFELKELKTFATFIKPFTWEFSDLYL